MKKRLLLLPLMAAFVLGGCSLDLGFIKIGDTPTQDNGQNQQDDGNHSYDDNDDGGNEDTPPTPVVPSVESVTITGSAQELSLYGTMQLTANVVVKNGASQAVTWSSSDETVATVKDGLVTPKKVGSVTITATSKADTSKSDSVTFTIFDKGFDPTFIDQGYEYVKEFPVSAIKEFLGTGSYEIYALENLVGGAYVIEYAATSSTAAAIEVVVNDARDGEYARILYEAGFSRLYVNSYDQYEAVDPTGKYTVAFGSEFDFETYEYVGPTTFYFYKSSDVWESSELTSDVAWDLKKIINEDPEEIAIALEYLTNVPFVKLGEDYEIEMVIDDSAKEEIISLLEMFGMDPASMTEEELNEWLELLGYEGPEVYFSIYDYSLCEPFEGYDAVLEGAGYVAQQDEEGYTYYELADGLNAYVLSYGFASSGNTIIVEQAPATLLEFPLEAVNSFIETEIGSENRAIAYEETKGASFMAQISNGSIVVAVDYVVLEEAAAYAAKYQEAGFEVKYTPSSDYAYPSWECTKGKLDIYFAIQQVTDESGEYIDEGPLYIYFMCDDTKHEEQGIYLPEAMTVKLFEQELVLPLEIVKLENPVFTVVSSNPEVATVEGLNVTLVAGGETTITVSVQDTSFVASMVLTVDEKTYDDEALEELAAWLEECGVEDYTLPLPEGTHIASEEDFYYDEYYECYTIMLNTSVTDMEYYTQLETAGYTIGEDEYGTYARLGDVEVSAWEYEPGVLEIDVYYVPEEVSGEGSSFDYSELSSAVNTIGDFTVDCHKVGGEAAPVVFNDEELRMYAGNEMIISSSGEPITSIDFYSCDCTSKVGATFAASTGTLTKTDYGYHWEGNATEIKFTCTKVDDNHKQTHFFSIEVNGGGSGGGGGGSSIDVETALEEIEEITVDIAAAYLEKSASQIKVGYEDEDDVDVYVWDYSLYGFICSDFSVQASGNESSDLSKMKAALPSGATLDSYNTYEEDDYHDIWYTYGDYSIGIYYYDGDASFAVVPTEMLDIYFEMMYGE